MLLLPFLRQTQIPPGTTEALTVAGQIPPLTYVAIGVVITALVFLILALAIRLIAKGTSSKDQAEAAALTGYAKVLENTIKEYQDDRKRAEERGEKKDADYQKSLLTISENNRVGLAQIADHLAAQTDVMGVWVEDGKNTNTSLKTVQDEVTKVPGAVKEGTAAVAEKYHGDTRTAINKHFDAGLESIRTEIKALTDAINKSNELVSKNFADDGTVLLMFNRLAGQVEQLTSHLDKALQGQKGTTTNETQITITGTPVNPVIPAADAGSPGNGAGDAGSHPGNNGAGGNPVLRDEYASPGSDGSPGNG